MEITVTHTSASDRKHNLRIEFSVTGKYRLPTGPSMAHAGGDPAEYPELEIQEIVLIRKGKGRVIDLDLEGAYDDDMFQFARGYTAARGYEA